MNFAKSAPKQAKLVPNMGLKDRNAFGLESCAELAYEITAADQLPALFKTIKEQKITWQVLGGGSNVILPERLLGMTLLMNIQGQELLGSDDQAVFISVGAGVNWHEFVSWTLEQNLPGLENLALIPGTVGAAPIQNIGAYGVEIGEYIDGIEVFDSFDHSFVTLSKESCQFAYRDSYFKKNPNQFIVTRVVFKIPKSWTPRLQYSDLAKQFENIDGDSPSAEEIYVAVCKIRTSKLPDPKVIGNAGSFFQNPIIPYEQYKILIRQFPQLVSYPDKPEKRKLAAGWLIDQCGFKGLNMGSVGVYKNQALVLVNHGDGTAKDILDLAQLIQDKVHQTFGVRLLIEPNIL